MQNTHCLKTWPDLYQLIKTGKKTFEYRRNDRDFKVGDVLKLEEWRPDTAAYTGAWLEVRVTLLVTDCPGLPPGYCIMQVELI